MSKSLRSIALGSFLLMAALVGTPALGEEVKVTAMRLGSQMEADGSGFYNELLLYILNRTGMDFSYDVLPMRRMWKEFISKRYDCAWSVNSETVTNLGYKDLELIDSFQLMQTIAYVFVPPGQQAITSLKELEGKKIGIVHGLPVEYFAFGDVAVKPVYVPNEDIKVRMLSRGRLDAIVGWYPDVIAAFRNERLEPTAYNKSLKLAEVGVGIVCYDNVKNREFIAAVNKIIKDFAGSREFHGILAKYGAF